jgi:hypothetical protein
MELAHIYRGWRIPSDCRDLVAMVDKGCISGVIMGMFARVLPLAK